MRSAVIAEKILVLVTTPDRASAIAGDLVDDASRSGMLRFWWHLVTTVGSLVRSELVADPARMASLAFRAWLLNLVQLVVATVVLVVAMLIATVPLVHFGWISQPAALNCSYALGFISVIICDFRVGKWLARRTPGREVAAVCALGLANMATGFVLTLGFTLSFGATLSFRSIVEGSLEAIPITLLFLLPTFAGAIRIRQRANHARA